MSFTPHTPTEVKQMLDTIGVTSIDQLFEEIPVNLRAKPLDGIPEGINEAAMMRIMQQLAAQDAIKLNFIGAGSYQHHIPAAVWDVVGRGEFMTAYTPYQAEASQGTLQLIYEYQTMMTSLMALDVSNASMYEGASSLAEAVLMAVRANKDSQSKRILIAGEISPAYVDTVNTIVKQQGITLQQVHFGMDVDPLKKLAPYAGQDFAAVIVAQPNFLGRIQAVDVITDWAHQQKALVIGLVNPLAMALLKPPGQWGTQGVDIACGEGQPLGVPMASGGPYFGFMCCKQDIVRQMPGRIIGRTIDQDGKPGFCLTLQAREQHIRRAKATSNICTNQGLLATAGTIYMSLMGPEGLKRVAAQCHANTRLLAQKLAKLSNIKVLSTQPYFHEIVVQLTKPVQPVLAKLAAEGIQAGYDLSAKFPELGNALLICSTEVHVEEDINELVQGLQKVLV